MANGLTPQVVDIPLLLPNQTPPKHAGPLGRLTSMVNAQIKHFLPSSQTQPQKVEVIPRDGFTALTNECRDSATGAVVTPDWSNPELLAPLGNQLVSICDSVPRVNNGASWTNYGNQRVVTQQLSEDVLHTTNHVLGAPDSAYLAGVTCFVWTEQSAAGPVTLLTSMVAFRGDDGAWIRTPFQLFQNSSGNALVRVIQDQANFWVVFNTGNKIAINVFDTHGTLVAFDSTTIGMTWTPTPGYWDIAWTGSQAPSLMLIQPHAFTSTGTDVGFDVWTMSVAGSVITITARGFVSGAHCSGPLAFSVNPLANSLFYVDTVGTANHLYTYEISVLGANLAQYDYGAVLAGSGIPDGITGWVEANGAGVIAHVAYSLLSNFSPPAGPANDPGLRYTRSYACTRAGAVSRTNHVNGLLLSSRAFKVDQDWYAATYYQSGGGTVATTSPETVATDDTLDYFTGDTVQPVKVSPGDFATGAAQSPGNGMATATQLIASIAHNASDNVVAATSTWHFVNAAFSGGGITWNQTTGAGSPAAAGAILHITGAANAQNNGDWFIVTVTSSTDIITEAFSLQGNPMVNESFGVGVTASVTQVWALIVPTGSINLAQFDNPVPYPPQALYSQFTGGVVTVSGSGGVFNGNYVVFRMYANTTWHGRFLAGSNLILLTKTSGSAGADNGAYLFGSITGIFTGTTVTVAPLVPNDWVLFGLIESHDTRTGVDIALTVNGALNGGNNNPLGFPETAISGSYNRIGSVTGSQPLQVAETFATNPGDATPTIARVLVDPKKAFMWHLVNKTFDPSYINATLTFGGLTGHPEDAGTYRIIALVPSIDAHTFIAVPANGQTGQTLYNMTSFETVKITRDASAGQPAYQPCWYLMPLSFAQNVAGRWEWAIAYADWRHDGEHVAGGTFECNGYPLALSTVTPALQGQQLVLPYRAQSFTAGQTVTNSSGQIVGIQSSAESTVGLKLFTFSGVGQAVANSDELLLPGPQASEFSASGFTEDGINLGPELAFGTQGVSGLALALTLGATYQYVVVWEVTSESGDRIWSVTSPPFSISLQGANDQVTLGGRMPGPTNRIVGVSIYRTANFGNPPTATIQHYKITNDLAVNGPGFTFTSVNGGPVNDTWQFVDVAADVNIPRAETLLTDKGFLQRFPAPAYSQGVGSWEDRTWVIGYDGAIWMSGEKTEGDAVWFHPAFRFVLPTDDTPVALAAMENYLLVFCMRSIWFIPAVQFPDNTGANGTLPTPQPLPFRNGCTGFAQTVKSGVAYSSTAGGVWLINRSLQNIYLSQPMQDDLAASGLAITGMTVDGTQRLVVVTNSPDIFVFDELSQAWLHWVVGGNASLVATWQGNAVYEDATRVRAQAPGTYADVTDGVPVASVPVITLALVSLGTVKGLKRVWAINLTGTVLGICNIDATLTYPDDNQPTTHFGPYPVVPGFGPLNIEINPMIEEATSFGLTVTADFSGGLTPGASFALELITAECGIEPTMAKRPDASRLPGS